MVGIIQEQHPDRARLFMQWKEMEWPILVDSYNMLNVPYVPITLLLDEHGVIREIDPASERTNGLEANFLTRKFERPASATDERPHIPDLAALERATSEGTSNAWRSFGDALAIWGGPKRIEDLIRAYQKALSIDPGDERTLFRLGVAMRKRYDSDDRQPGDFQAAVDHWTAALDIDPNQYIYRRRIQQYGPRLDKPYPFYHWVVTARAEISGRGEVPAPLGIEPGGAEFAEPLDEFTAARLPPDEPDPRGRVLRDEGKFIDVEITAVPRIIAPGTIARFHVSFRPEQRAKAHWNNQAQELVLWIDPPPGWEVEQRYLTHPLPPNAVSQEVRTLEVEAKAPDGVPAGVAEIPAYALYYVCEDVNGICMYRRKDLNLPVRIR